MNPYSPRRKQTTAERGRWAESLARNFLLNEGLELLGENFRTRRGEIDIVMRDGETTVFIEVRFRGRSSFATGAESVDHGKRRRIARAAEVYLQRFPAAAERPCRFDVVSISEAGAPARIRWIKQAFDA